MMKTVHLIINPNAGTRQARRFLPEMISVFNRADYLCSVYITGQRGDACETLCAFLNKDGGTVVFGVTKKGKLTGQSTPKYASRGWRELKQEMF